MRDTELAAIYGLEIRGATKTATATDPAQAVRARRFVAGAALDAADCAKLLDMLDLVPDSMTLTVEVS